MYDPPGKDGLATFVARMMHRGTSRHTFQEISELTDGVGASGLATIAVCDCSPNRVASEPSVCGRLTSRPLLEGRLHPGGRDL